MSTYTTLNQIRKHHPCASGWINLLGYLGNTKADDEPLPLSTILESNGLDDAIWCLRSLPDSELRKIQTFTLRIANTVRHLMTDERSIKALDTVQKYLDGKTSYAAAAAAAVAAAAAAAEAAEAAAAVAAAAAAVAAAYAAYAAAVATVAVNAVSADDVETIFKEVFC